MHDLVEMCKYQQTLPAAFPFMCKVLTRFMNVLFRFADEDICQ